MHEVALIKNLVNILEKEIANSGVGDVKTVYLEIGTLHYLDPEIMNTCFSHIRKYDKLRNAKIDIKVLPAKIKCSDCGRENVIRERVLGCSGCLSRNVDVISGNEFNLKSIEW